MNKNFMYYDKNIFIGTDFKPKYPIIFNNFGTIERIIKRDVVIYKCQSIDKKYLIMYIIHTHYFVSDKESTKYYIVCKARKFTKLDDEFFAYVMWSRAEHFEIHYIGDEITKKKLYEKERQKMMYMHYENDKNKTILSRYNERGRTRYEYIFSLENIKKQLNTFFNKFK